MIYRYRCAVPNCTAKFKHWETAQRHIDWEHNGGGRIASVIRDKRTSRAKYKQ